MEQWKVIPRYTRYEVSNLGQVRNIKTGRIMKQHRHNGYCCLRLTYEPKKSRVVFVHRLVWEAFKYEIPNKFEIDHLNRVKDDNRLENLECVSPIENRKRQRNRTFGYTKKEKRALVKEAKRLRKEGESYRNVAEKLGVTYQAARNWVDYKEKIPKWTAEVKRMREAGIPIREIARTLKVSRNLVKRRIRLLEA